MLADAGSNRMRESAVIDFPHPLSPTNPRISPRPTVNETPSTGRTDPRRCLIVVVKPFTSRRWPAVTPIAALVAGGGACTERSAYGRPRGRVTGHRAG